MKEIRGGAYTQKMNFLFDMPYVKWSYWTASLDDKLFINESEK